MTSTFTVNTIANASSFGPCVRISLMPDSKASYQQIVANTPIYITLDGPLAGDRRLAHPIVVKMEEDDGEVLVTEPNFFIHASGPTIVEAIETFKRVFSGYLDVLSLEEETLGAYLQAELEYLRSVILD